MLWNHCVKCEETKKGHGQQKNIKGAIRKTVGRHNFTHAEPFE